MASKILYNINDLVWAKMKGSPPWPARISEPLSNCKPPKNKKAHFIYFFGAKNFDWVLEECLTPHSETMLNKWDNKKSAPYQRAIAEFIAFSKSSQKNSAKNVKATSSMKKESPEREIYKEEIVPKKKCFSKKGNKRESLRKSKNGAKKCQVKNITQKRPLDVKEEMDECTSKKKKKLELSDEFDSDEDNMSHLNSHVGHYNIVQRKETLKIGFIGLGNIGRAAVHDLLRSGHDVFIWNKTPYKCKEFVNIGARQAHSPADLIVACHITFCCVSDANASKAIIYGNHGILEGLEQAQNLDKISRGYVEMTSIDPETSRMIEDVISEKGGKYLEAPICGNSAQGITILAAGSRNLFLNCETCFEAMVKHAHFVSCDVGFGSKMSAVFRVFSGTVYAAAAELLKLATILGLEDEVILKLLDAGPLQTQNVIEKCRRMMNSDFKTATPLKHIQKDLNLTLLLGNKFSHYMPLISAANEVYKHARDLQYSDLDVSAVYQVLNP